VTTDTPSSIHLQIADLLDAWVAEDGWNDQRWQRFDALIKSVEVDGRLAHADEELIHYSGEFNSYNLLGFRVKPNKSQVTQYKDEFHNIAEALRMGTSWEEYQRENGILEGSEINRATARWFKGLFYADYIHRAETFSFIDTGLRPRVSLQGCSVFDARSICVPSNRSAVNLLALTPTGKQQGIYSTECGAALRLPKAK